jgi:hypothetical protein
MSSVIDFLEKMGSDAHWRTASQDELELALQETDIAPAERSAILAQDALELRALLREIPLFMVQIPPGEIPPGEEEEEEEEGEEEGDEKHDSMGLCHASSASSLAHV